MAEDDQAEPRRHGLFWRRVIAGLVVFFALLVLVHRPILLAIGRRDRAGLRGKTQSKG